MGPVPRTVQEAVSCLLRNMPPDEQRLLASLPERRLDETHMGLGVWVRNEMMLWSGNDDLFADTGAVHPDGASAVIIRAFWEHLRKGLNG